MTACTLGKTLTQERHTYSRETQVRCYLKNQMADISKSFNCHVCNASLAKQCTVKLECSHQLCSTCFPLTEGRSVCPTCSPAAPPFASDANNGFPTTYTRMYSKNTEQAPPKPATTSKKINNDSETCTALNPSRLTVPTSVPSSGSSSYSSSPAVPSSPFLTDSLMKMIPNDSCIFERLDYMESADDSALCQSRNCAEGSVRQMFQRLLTEAEAGRQLDDGRWGPGSVRRDLAEYVRSLREHSVAFLEKLNQTGIDEAVFVERIEASEREVKRMATERRRAIDRAEKELLWKLESRKKEQLQESVAVRQDTELCIGQLDSLTKTIQKAMETRDEGGLNQILLEVQDDVRRAIERRIATVNFGTVSFIYSPENFLQEDRANILGEIEFPPNKDKDDQKIFLSSPPPLIHSIDDPSSGQAVVGLTVLADRIYVIRASSHYIEVYHETYFSAQHHLTLLHLMNPMLVPSASDLSSCPASQTLYVADSANACVYRLDTDGKLLTHWKLPNNYTGLSVTGTGTVLIGGGGRIIEYDQSGKTLRKIGPSTLCRVTARRRNGVALDTPRHFVRRNSGSMVVCDWKNQTSNHIVYEVDDRGQVRSYFGGEPGDGDCDLDEPCCLATAPLDHVIVADRVNQRVKLLDSGLNFVRNLVDRKELGGRGQPNRLFLDVASGRLYVGLTDGRIQIYRTIF